MVDAGRTGETEAIAVRPGSERAAQRELGVVAAVVEEAGDVGRAALVDQGQRRGEAEQLQLVVGEGEPGDRQPVAARSGSISV